MYGRVFDRGPLITTVADLNAWQPSKLFCLEIDRMFLISKMEARQLFLIFGVVAIALLVIRF